MPPLRHRDQVSESVSETMVKTVMTAARTMRMKRDNGIFISSSLDMWSHGSYTRKGVVFMAIEVGA